LEFYPEDEDVDDKRLATPSTLTPWHTPNFSIGMKFYVFELMVNEQRTWIDGKTHYKFVQMPITSTVSNWNN
jgi:hypothetical protein